jgi:hypothetical protein
VTNEAVMRLVGLAEATEQYAESLDDEQLAQIYWGKALGLLQAAQMVAAEAALCPSGSSGGPEPLGPDGGGVVAESD